MTKTLLRPLSFLALVSGGAVLVTLAHCGSSPSDVSEFQESGPRVFDASVPDIDVSDSGTVAVITDSTVPDTFVPDVIEAAAPDVVVPDTGSLCLPLVLFGPAITIQRSEATPPVAAGGTVLDGTYFLTDYTQYFVPGDAGTPGPANPSQSALVVAGNTWRLESKMATGSQGETYSVTLSHTDVILTGICPSQGNQVSLGYTASGNTLTTFVITASSSSPAGTRIALVSTYTKQ